MHGLGRVQANGTLFKVTKAALLVCAQAVEHAGHGGTAGTEVVAHHWERVMPQPQQATWAHRMSVPPSLALTQPRTAQIGRARRWLLKACRSVAQALEHGGNGTVGAVVQSGQTDARRVEKGTCYVLEWLELLQAYAAWKKMPL